MLDDGGGKAREDVSHWSSLLVRDFLGDVLCTVAKQPTKANNPPGAITRLELPEIPKPFNIQTLYMHLKQ